MRFVLRPFLSTIFASVALVTLLGSLSATASAQSSREDAIRKSQELFDTALTLADEVRRTCGCTNTAAALQNIADAATEIELESRFGSRAGAVEKLKDAIRGIRYLRRYLPHVPNAYIRLQIKREILIAINETGSAVMGSRWVIVRHAPQPGENEESALNRSLDYMEQNLGNYAQSDF